MRVCVRTTEKENEKERAYITCRLVRMLKKKTKIWVMGVEIM